MRKEGCWIAVAVMLSLLVALPVFSQDGSMIGAPSIQSVSINNMSLQSHTLLCGGKAQQGTPIAGRGTVSANGTSGSFTISGIPLTASVYKATLFWTVLTNSTSSTAGSTPTFNGVGITGTNIGAAPESPCFPQAATVAYKADVTALVTSPGNGVYNVAGFAGGSNFTEGATLQILWTDPNGPLVEDVLYHTSAGGTLAVTLAEAFSQSLGGFLTNAAGPVTGTLYEVIGNGQSNAGENLRFDSCAAGTINLDNSLDGSTSSKAPGTCASVISPTQCYWDDDIVNVSSQMTNACSSATLSSSGAAGGSDCFDWDALNLLVSTDQAHACSVCGSYVDTQCPPGGIYNNHGDYVSCVAHAAETILAAMPLGGTCPREEVQSCCVNPRARSDVGKK